MPLSRLRVYASTPPLDMCAQRRPAKSLIVCTLVEPMPSACEQVAFEPVVPARTYRSLGHLRHRPGAPDVHLTQFRSVTSPSGREKLVNASA